MSGPKGGTYAVVSAEELERRALRTAQDRYVRAAAECNAIGVSLSSYDEQVTPLDVEARGDSVQVSAAAAIAELEAKVLRERLSDHRVQAALAAIPKVTIQLDDASPSGAQTEYSVTTPDPKVTADLLAKANAMLAQLVGETGQDASSLLLSKLAGVHAASGDRQQRMALDDLRLAVQRVRDGHRAKLRLARDRSRVLAALDGCEGLEAIRIREAVSDSAPDGHLPVSVEQARKIAERDSAERDAGFVQNAVVSVLEDLGYAMGAQMSVTVAHDGALLELPRHPGHGARLRARGDQLQFYVVRLGDVGDPDVDADAEVEACQVFAEVHEKLESAGVQWHLQRKDPPGAVPVAHQSTRPDSLIRRRERPKRRRRGTSEREIPG